MDAPSQTNTLRASDSDAAVLAILLAVSVSHLLNDTIQSLLSAIYPVLKDSFALSFAQIGLITFVFQITASLLQPLVGTITDRRPMPFSLPIGMGASLYLNSYSRSQETEADDLGIRYLSRAGYPPEAMASFLSALTRSAQLEAAEQGQEYKEMRSFTSTHPMTGDRVQRAGQMAGQYPTQSVRIGTDTHLNIINGMVYGDSAKQGFVRGAEFVHPDLGFAFRVPNGSPDSRRIEHRVTGADANPYLVLAAILAGIHYGIVNEIDPGEPAEGNACEIVDEGLPLYLPSALKRFRNSQVMRQYLTDRYVDVYAETKILEFEKFQEAISPLEYDWYL